MFINRSVLCLRDNDTIKASPALASHADRVRRRMENLSEEKDPWSCDHEEIFKNKDINNSSRHSNKDKRWSRFITTPIIPKRNNENSTVGRMFTRRP